MEQSEKKQEQAAKMEQADEELKAQFARSHAWHLVKQSLLAKIMDMDSLSATIEGLTKKGKSLDEIKELMYTNGKAVTIVINWINQIETMGGITDANFAQEVQDRKKEQIIVQLPD
jgi:hypothetical protein